VRDAARTWLKPNRSVTGYLIKDTTPQNTTAKGEKGDKSEGKRS
jgi:hypothetical protein